MIQISYISSAARTMDTEQLLNLLSHCLAYNSSHAITGMLLYGNGIFLQALEGEEDVVSALYDKIEKDERHVDVKFLSRKTIEARQYSEWSMGFQRLSGEDLQIVEGLRDGATKGLDGKPASQDVGAYETVMENYVTWNPLLREVDETERLVKHLQTSLKRATGGLEIARLVLESIVDTHKTHGFSESNERLCTFALEQLSRI